MQLFLDTTNIMLRHALVLREQLDMGIGAFSAIDDPDGDSGFVSIIAVANAAQIVQQEGSRCHRTGGFKPPTE